MFSLKSFLTASWLRCCPGRPKSQAASGSACFCSHFRLHKQTGILLFKHTLGNKALWKWSAPGAGSSQGVKSTVTARVLRFVVLPVAALQGVPISDGMKVWESSVLNAKSPFQAELHHPEGIPCPEQQTWQPSSAGLQARLQGQASSCHPAPARAACSVRRRVTQGFSTKRSK